MWKVTCEMVRGVLEYYVEHSVTGERKGTFDCERWASEFAAFLNGKENDHDRTGSKEDPA